MFLVTQGQGAKGGRLIQKYSEGPSEWRGCLDLVCPGEMSSAGVPWEATRVMLCPRSFAKRGRFMATHGEGTHHVLLKPSPTVQGASF
jgi:hypothetical protein